MEEELAAALGPPILGPGPLQVTSRDVTPVLGEMERALPGSKTFGQSF